MGKAVDFIWSTIQTALAIGITRGSFELCPGVGQITDQQFLKRFFGEITMLVEGQGHSLTYWILSLSGGSGPLTAFSMGWCFQVSRPGCEMENPHSNNWRQTARALKVACRDTLSPGTCFGPQRWPRKSPGRTSQIPLHSTPVKPTQWNPDMTDALVLPLHSWNLSVLEPLPEKQFKLVVKGTVSGTGLLGLKTQLCYSCCGTLWPPVATFVKWG